MFISGMSGNEIYCLAQKGFTPGEIAVGNSVYSMGLGGALGAIGRSVSGGEIQQGTEDGRPFLVVHVHGSVGASLCVGDAVEVDSDHPVREVAAEGAEVDAVGDDDPPER